MFARTVRVVSMPPVCLRVHTHPELPVFHAECVGSTKRLMDRMALASCLQHKCAGCGRGMGDAGSMLFRCVVPLLCTLCTLTVRNQMSNMPAGILRGLSASRGYRRSWG